jgi:hypothetical protein
MKKLVQNEQGFIPMLLTILGVIVAIVIFAYMRVANNGN